MLSVSQFISWFALPWTKKNVLCIFKWFMRLWWRWSWLDFSFDSDDTVDWERKCKTAVKRNHKSCKMKALCNHLMILSLPSPISHPTNKSQGKSTKNMMKMAIWIMYESLATHAAPVQFSIYYNTSRESPGPIMAPFSQRTLQTVDKVEKQKMMVKKKSRLLLD